MSEVSIDNHLDLAFKPGIHEQTRSFLIGDKRFSCSLQQQLENIQIYEKMASYR